MKLLLSLALGTLLHALSGCVNVDLVTKRSRGDSASLAHVVDFTRTQLEYMRVNGHFTDCGYVLRSIKIAGTECHNGEWEYGGFKYMLRVNDATFRLVARPSVYSRTGTRSLWVNESGVVRATYRDEDPTEHDLPITRVVP
jgi:hypothetical protein